jgi:hypothetical protein
MQSGSKLLMQNSKAKPSQINSKQNCCLKTDRTYGEVSVNEGPREEDIESSINKI